jgi:hypothetical protein
VFNDSGFLEYDGDYRVVGIVRNDHGIRVEYVQPVITLYDSGGRVIDCGYTYINAYHLDSGGSRSFEETFYYRDYSVVTSYQIVVDGYPQSGIGRPGFGSIDDPDRGYCRANQGQTQAGEHQDHHGQSQDGHHVDPPRLSKSEYYPSD